MLSKLIQQRGEQESRVLLLPPTRKDSEAISRLLRSAEIGCHVCASPAELAEELRRGGALAIVSEESLKPEFPQLSQVLHDQPVWSDLPVVVLSRAGVESPALQLALGSLGNATIVERPMRVSTMLSIVRTSLRARERQYQVRDHLDARQQGEEALRQSEQRLRAVIEASPECVKIVAPDGALLFMNPAGIAMIEADGLESVEGACVYEMIAAEYRRDWLARHARVCAGERLNWQFEIIGLGGTRRWMETHAVPLPMTNGQTAQLAVTRDVTMRREREIEREQLLESERAARSEAERASQMKDEFLATLSHELRTPLNAILGWAQLMRGGQFALPEEAQEGMEIIERNARAQTQIIEDLLDMSRIISGKIRLNLERIDLSAVIKAAMETVAPATDAKGIELHAAFEASGIVLGDPHRLQQVFWNLLSNAVKFTPRGGSVQVALARVNSQIEVRVIDSGEGIEAEFLPHVFDRFRQADASTTRIHGGLGLGLAIVRQLVELHGGSISASSDGPGLGSAFVVSLPVAAVANERQAIAERRRLAASQSLEMVSAPQLTGLTVLVVDDEPDARALLQRLLTERQATVRVAASADEAMRRLESERPDVIVSDIGMPGEDGYALIRRVRALPANQGGATPAVALTAYARSQDRVAAMVAGFQHHLSKPVDPAELVAVVASLQRMAPPLA